MERIIINGIILFKKLFGKFSFCPVKLRRQEMNIKFRNLNNISLFILIISLVFACCSSNAIAADKILKEIVLQVNPNIITLPDNEVSKVPIGAARIRSTDLRTLNQDYNAVSIEKLFKLGEKSKLANLEIKGLKKVDKKTKEILTDIVDINNVFTKDIKKTQEEKGENVVELNNAFIIQFEFDEETNMNGIVNAYKALPVVMNAQYIVRTKK